MFLKLSRQDFITYIIINKFNTGRTRVLLVSLKNLWKQPKRKSTISYEKDLESLTYSRSVQVLEP